MIAPFPHNETERLSALRASGVLDTASEAEYDDITRLAAQICRVPVAAISFIDENRQWVKSIVGFSAGETPRDTAFCAHTILQQNLLVVPDTTADPRFADNPSVTGKPHIRFYAGAPLVTEEGHALGALCVVDDRPNSLTSEQELTLKLLARQVSSHVNSYRRVTAQRRAEAALAETQAALDAVLESAPVILYAADAEGMVTRLEGKGLAALGLSPDAAVGRSLFELIEDSENAANTRRALAGKAVSCNTWLKGMCLHTEMRPMQGADGSPNGLIGVCLDVTEQQRAEERIKDHAVVLEFQELQKCELEKANTELAALATTDGLTGLKNHRAFQERLAEEVSRAARYGSPLSLIMLDVDHFKQYNDCFGHPAGDAVLMTVAHALQDGARDTDLVARYGGEEFALILPQTNEEGAAAFAERLRTSVERSAWPLRAVTASLGLALHCGKESASELLARADSALYESKTRGRNRVSCASGVPFHCRRF